MRDSFREKVKDRVERLVGTNAYAGAAPRGFQLGTKTRRRRFYLAADELR